MFKKIVFYDNFTDAIAGTWSTFLVQGLILFLLGLAILLMPQLLAAMVAATFMALGALCFVLAFQTRRVKKAYRLWRDEFWEPF